ncbi:unnamed protein product, partial [Staurois parvus]
VSKISSSGIWVRPDPVPSVLISELGNFSEEAHCRHTPSINCNNVMNNSLFIIAGHCKPLNTFIVSNTATVKAICSRVAGERIVLSSTSFQLIICTRRSDVTPPCPYYSNTQSNVICVICSNGFPVHFVGVGKC